jgi:hypothetical protein
MKNGIFYGVVTVLLAVLLTSCCTTPPQESHNVNLYPQHRDWWCWAACTEMLSDYEGHRVQQCDSANFVHGTPPNCCTGCTGVCPCWGAAWGATIADIQNNWTHWNFTYQYVASSLSWDEFKKTLSQRPFCRKSPIYAVVGSHVVVVTAYADIRLAAQHLKIVYYNDPWPPDCQGGYGNQCWPGAGGEARVNTYDGFKAWPWWASFHSFQYAGP